MKKLIAKIKKEVELNSKIDIELPVQFNDTNGVIYAEVIKKIYIADKTHYNQKRE